MLHLQSVVKLLANVIADYQTSQKSLQRLTVRYPASVLDALISVEGFKLDQNHDRAYVSNGLNKCAVWQRFNRACVLS